MVYKARDTVKKSDQIINKELHSKTSNMEYTFSKRQKFSIPTHNRFESLNMEADETTDTTTEQTQENTPQKTQKTFKPPPISIQGKPDKPQELIK